MVFESNIRIDQNKLNLLLKKCNLSIERVISEYDGSRQELREILLGRAKVKNCMILNYICKNLGCRVQELFSDEVVEEIFYYGLARY